MELEQILIDPNTSAFHKRIQILKELTQLYEYARIDGNMNSALKALAILTEQLGFLKSQQCSLKEMSEEDLEWLLRSEQT